MSGWTKTKEKGYTKDGFLKNIMGQYRTQTLFWETRYRATNEDSFPIFTLDDADKTVDGITYYSLRKIYMTYDHVPGYEYDFAMDIFGSWEHWVRIQKDSVLKKHFQEWQDALAVKRKAEGIKQIIKGMREDPIKGASNAKFLADLGWETKRGRPSKEEVIRQQKLQAGIESELSEDIERLGLSLVKTK